MKSKNHRNIFKLSILIVFECVIFIFILMIFMQGSNFIVVKTVSSGIENITNAFYVFNSKQNKIIPHPNMKQVNYALSYVERINYYDYPLTSNDKGYGWNPKRDIPEKVNCRDYAMTFAAYYGHPALIATSKGHAFVYINGVIIEPQQTKEEFRYKFRMQNTDYKIVRRNVIRPEHEIEIKEHFSNLDIK